MKTIDQVDEIEKEIKKLSDCLVVDGFDKEIEVGSVIFVGPFRNRGNHGAFILITKINKKSFKGVEVLQSYSPKTIWTVRKDSAYAKVGKTKEGLMNMKWVG